jgi:hypothetical protein
MFGTALGQIAPSALHALGNVTLNQSPAVISLPSGTPVREIFRPLLRFG